MLHSSSNLVRLVIVEQLEAHRGPVSAIINRAEFVRPVTHILACNDPLARALTLMSLSLFLFLLLYLGRERKGRGVGQREVNAISASKVTLGTFRRKDSVN